MRIRNENPLWCRHFRATSYIAWRPGARSERAARRQGASSRTAVARQRVGLLGSSHWSAIACAPAAAYRPPLKRAQSRARPALTIVSAMSWHRDSRSLRTGCRCWCRQAHSPARGRAPSRAWLPRPRGRPVRHAPAPPGPCRMRGLPSVTVSPSATKVTPWPGCGVQGGARGRGVEFGFGFTDGEGFEFGVLLHDAKVRYPHQGCKDAAPTVGPGGSRINGLPRPDDPDASASGRSPTIMVATQAPTRMFAGRAGRSNTLPANPPRAHRRSRRLPG